jgi:hypothetical protein
MVQAPRFAVASVVVKVNAPGAIWLATVKGSDGLRSAAEASLVVEVVEHTAFCSAPVTAYKDGTTVMRSFNLKKWALEPTTVGTRTDTELTGTTVVTGTDTEPTVVQSCEPLLER